MRVPSPCALAMLALALFCCGFLPCQAADLSDSAAAQSALGPEWQRLSRRAGMIFTGTVLSASPPARCGDTPNGRDAACRVSLAAIPAASATTDLRFRIDLPIAGVDHGKTLTIREWTGALDRQPPLRPGDRVLLFLYPPSRLGLTSPVGGHQGQIRLDSTGQRIKKNVPSSRPIIVKQLARAIRAARGE
ncbi:MAG TPA: hypothetical protein VMT67_10460 [Terriglobales bacterium]|nr:hypothetical protein [Terriglobales bacterium]